MHPAYSVIVFTAASGAGYGLLAWLAMFAAAGLIPATRWLGFAGLGLALGLITLGLLSSMAHLGRPERAWRALSQWRSSWLSREGVAAVLTYLPAGVLGIGWVFFETVSGGLAVAAWLTVLGALATVWCTGMIYASLPTIRAWHQPLVPPVYIALALATGAVLFNLILLVFGQATGFTAALAALASGVALTLKAIYWRMVADAPKTYTVESATGLGRFGKVRMLEPPHTQPNYVMREMGYKVARKHARKLRRVTVLLLFAFPILASLLMIFAPPVTALLLAVFATTSAAIGVIIERWLFFAEAEHVSMLYYGAEKA